MNTIYTNKAPAAIGPYSQAIEVDKYLFLSGQIPVDPATGKVVNGNAGEQAEQVIKNIEAILKEAGASFAEVVKTTCFLKSMDDFAEFNVVYGKYFINKPARSCVAVQALPLNVLCEIEVIAKIK